MNIWKKIASIPVLFFVTFLLISCGKNYREVPLNFEHEGDQLSGTIILPKEGNKPFSVLVFVHGDGATPYDAYGYYRPLWKRLAKQGIASFSWDKPGVGRSSGDWQNQSMDDRADETIAAIEMLKKRTDIAPGKIGLLGYSQAGWVLPLVASKSDYPDFMVLVSAAINWMDQGAYMTKIRLTRQGSSNTQIAQEIVEFRSTTEQLFQPSATYEEYLQFYSDNKMPKDNKEELMSQQRFQFVKLNWLSDAKESLKNINSPTLVIFGKHDLNVDISESIGVYKNIFAQADNRNLTIKVFSDAQHSLLKEKHFPEIVPGIKFVIKLEMLGDKAFADGFLDFVVNWIAGETK